MPNSRFNAMISQHCANFRSLFQDLTIRIFRDTDNESQHFHNGEFGSHRELVASVFLRPFTPDRYDVVNGFIIGQDDSDPAQCDILVIERDLAPFCNYRELGLFYPKEAIGALGEVKSLLNTTQFKDALEQVAKRICELRPGNAKAELVAELGTVDQRPESFDIWPDEPTQPYATTETATKAEVIGQPFTFLVCDRFSFGDVARGSLPQWITAYRKINEVASGSEDFMIPDAILSVSDGLLIRRRKNGNNRYQCISPGKDSTTHLKKFLSIYFSHLARWSSQRVSFQRYFQVSEQDMVFDHEELSGD